MLNFLKSLFRSAPPVDLSEVMTRKPYLVDVRTVAEYAYGHPRGSVNILIQQLASNIQKFKGKKDIIVFCRSGNRSNQAKILLESRGISNIIDAGPWENVAKYTG